MHEFHVRKNLLLVHNIAALDLSVDSEDPLDVISRVLGSESAYPKFSDKDLDISQSFRFISSSLRLSGRSVTESS